MRLLNHLIITVFVASWVLCAIGVEAVAQSERSGFTRLSPVRNEWERRVLRQRTTPNSAVRTVSMQVPSEPEELGPIGDQSQADLPPAPDVAQDTPDYRSPTIGSNPGCGQYRGGYEECVDSCGTCGECCPVNSCCCRPGWWMRDLRVFAGVHGFKGPADQGQNGNFGFHEGVNIGVPLGWTGLGFQAGVNAVHSNFEGYWANQQQQFSDRNQIFLTSGIFHRAMCGGLQWGVAFDLLHDNYMENSDLKQLRSETSLVHAGRREIGYYGAYGVDRDRVVDGQLDPTDMFAFFYRSYLENGGEGRFWAGVTGRGDGLLGADAWVPMGRGWALDARANYLIPKQGRHEGAIAEESWGLSIQLVWFLGQPAVCARSSPFRPLFNVADNSLFMVDRLN